LGAEHTLALARIATERADHSAQATGNMLLAQRFHGIGPDIQ